MTVDTSLRKHGKNVTLVHVNAQSLLAHFEEIIMQTNDYIVDILCVSETWRLPTTEYKHVNSSEFKIFRNDHGRGEEVLLSEPPEPEMPSAISSSLTQETLAVTDTVEQESKEKLGEEGNETTVESKNVEEEEMRNLNHSTPPLSRMQISHSRGASQVSSCGASLGHMSGKTFDS
ncbi:hypothetical protein SK128_015984 [Halocaridina rubra]|uniref:Uncharacterized protein n=1 Tax=Halocaridina rubra TaxID=373956 RepID=A0AAN8X2E5_HALRR